MKTITCRRLAIGLLGLAQICLHASPADACGIREGSAPYWVDNADVIVRARAIEQRGRKLTLDEIDGLISKRSWNPIRIGTTIRFEVVEVLRGNPIAALELDGEFTDVPELDENEPDIPRTWVRKAGRGGHCYALQYRAGQEYLLMLKAYGGSLTPYWAAMGATNEHVAGPEDPWLGWVRDYLRKKR